MSRLIYTFFLYLYKLGIRIASLANPKAALWIKGRKEIFETIRKKMLTVAPTLPGQPPVIWMHCASLGEFEQGRPLLEQVRRSHPSAKIILTFFSPSGYEVRKNYEGADAVFYLPMDSPANAKRFIDAIQPSLVLWVKYEYWFHYLSELKRRAIPLLLVSGIFRESQPFFKWYGGLWKEMLYCFTHFFVQNEASVQLLAGLGIKENVSLSGDTRFDRVISIASQATSVLYVDSFCKEDRVLVAGSTWDEDEVELLHYIKSHPGIKFIIAPHEVDEANIQDVKKMFPGALRYSTLVEWKGTIPEGCHILLIDNIGMLANLYRYATVAMVGGGFGASGIHNVLEAAVYGKPVVFGPVYEKYDEAVGLVEAGGAWVATGPITLENVLDELFDDKEKLNKSGAAAKQFVHDRAGASEEILSYIQEKRLLTR